MRLWMVFLAAAVVWVGMPADVLAADEGWLTSYAKATAEAKKTGKLILADFTGSDWCIWCKRLKAEVFDTKEFKAWAAKKVILLELDFPNSKAQSVELKAQNRKLKNKYGIRGYPTVLLLNANDEEVGRTGYMRGGPRPWIKNCEKLIAEYRKASTIRLAGSLRAGLASAKKSKRPLLMIVSPEAADTEQFEGGPAKNLGFVKMANSRTVATHVALAGKKDDDAEAKAFAQLKERFKIEDESRYVLIDPAGDKLLSQLPAMKSDKALTEGLEQALPKIPYKGQWLVDFARARAIAQSHKRVIFADFTGSDWCIWCKRLKAEVFDTKEFKAWAAEKVVLLELDFPNRKAQPAALKAQNKKLQKKYSIRGYPTILILDSSGKRIGKMGYMRGGPKPFIAKAESIIK